MMIAVFIFAALGVLGALHIAGPLARGAETARGRLGALAIAAVLAVGALGAYAVNGEPDAPGQPYAEMAERLRNTDPTLLGPAEQEERLRDAIRQDPEDATALALLGRFLSRTERELEAIALFERSLQLEESPRILSNLGQALVVLNEGQVTPEAERAFLAANAGDPALPEPAFFLGAAAYARGDRLDAAARWSDIIARLDEADPFRAAIAARAADLLSRPSGGPAVDAADPQSEAPFAGAAADGASMDEMVAMMVNGLEARLAEDPQDLSGWLTLARARVMQDRPDEARAALSQARAEFADDAGAEALVAAIETAFGLEESDA